MLVTGRPEARRRAELAKAVLAGIIYEVRRRGIFAAALSEEKELNVAVLSAWSSVHGLSMLTIDNRVGPTPLKIERLAQEVGRIFCYGPLQR